MAKRIQQESGEERVTAKLRPMMNLTARMPSVVSSSTSSSPGMRWYGSQDPWLQMIDQGNLIDSSQQVIQNWIMTVLGLLKSGKVRLRHTVDQGNLIKLLGMRVQQVRPHHGDTLLDGGPQSVRYGGMLHDRSGQPDSANPQEVADSETFVMGNDAAEFANKVKRSSAKKTENNVERCRLRRRTFNNLENVYGCDDECGDIHGKEFLV